MDKKSFQTSDQGVAAFLLCQGFTLMGALNTSDPYRRDFVFLNKPRKLTKEEQEKEIASLKGQIKRVESGERTIQDSINRYLEGDEWVRASNYLAKMRHARRVAREDSMDPEQL